MDSEVRDLISTLNNLSKELELLVVKSRPWRRLPTRSLDRGPDTEFSRHRALDTPVRLSVGGKVHVASREGMSK